jgi:hypothetical protein
LDRLRGKADASEQRLAQAEAELEAGWLDAELALLDFLTAAKDEAVAVRNIVAARAQAQRRSATEALRNLRDEAQAAAADAREELEDAYRRLAELAEAFRSRAGDAGEDAWAALQSGLVEARGVHDRTVVKISERLARRL